MTKFCVVIDPGHGGYDPGAVGQSGLRESDVVLEVARKAAQLLIDAGYSVRLTRPSNTYVSLGQRARIANQIKADLFISIHCNAAKNKVASGIETYHYPTSKNGKRLAELVQGRLIANTTRQDRGVKTAKFAVLRETAMPAALAEIGFISNATEDCLLQSTEYQAACAAAIAQAVRGYFNDEQNNG